MLKKRETLHAIPIYSCILDSTLSHVTKQTNIQITIIQPYEQANRYTNHNHPTVPKMAVDRIVGSLSRTYHTECRRVSQLVCVVITITSHYFYLLRVYGL